MITVEHTKTHRLPAPISRNPIDHESLDVLTTDAELVLIPCQIGINGLGVVVKDKHYHSILISRTEKIKAGDWILYQHPKQIGIVKPSIHKVINPNYSLEEPAYRVQFDTGYGVIKGCSKILALPEHFSPNQLQLIVKGILKEGKCLVECEDLCDYEGEELWEITPHKVIKLNPHITIYPVEEKMYTREEVEKAFNAGKMRYSSSGSTYHSFPTFQDFLENKEYFWDEGICWTKKNMNGLNKM